MVGFPQLVASKEESSSSVVAYAYIISIDNQDGKFSKKTMRRVRILSGYSIYELSIKKNGRQTNFLRLGFFSSKASANIVIRKISEEFTENIDMEIIGIPKSEEKYLQLWLKNTIEKKPNKRELYDRKKLELLMEQARLAMVQNDYRRAIANYTKIIGYEDSDFSQSALEYLGLARERNQQFAHAKAEYLRYIALYPESEGAERVKQRLAGLMSAAMEPKTKLRKVKTRKRQVGWLGYGGVTQYYRRDTYLDDQEGRNLLSSNAYSSFFYTAKLKNQRYELKNRISLSHNMDFEDSEDNKAIRISTLYSEAYHKKYKMQGRIGRQTQNSSGAYGRFDGAVLSYHYNPTVIMRVVSGFPVAFDSFDKIRTEKRFYSFNLELESLFNYFDLNSYFINQYEESILDRSAVGLELRHFDTKQSFYSTMEYDISYQVINNIVANLRYQILPKTTIGGNANYRRSPLISTTNALQGQQVTSLQELLATKTKEEIRHLARDRTAKFASLTATVIQKITKKIQISNDYTLSKLSSTVSSDGITGTQGTGYEHYISTQLIATDWYRKNDVTIAGLRYAAMSTGKRYTLNALRQDRLPKKIVLNARLRVDYQQRSNDSTILSLRPSVKLNYKYNKTFKFDLELGLDHSIRKHSFDEGNDTKGFLGVGYFLQF